MQSENLDSRSVPNETKSSTTTIPFKCQVCCDQEARYRCPGCQLRTCCVACVQRHKKQMGCSGERDKTAFVAKEDYSYSNLLSDLRFLEEVDRTKYLLKKERLKFTRPYKHCQILTHKASQRGVELRCMPPGSSRQRQNTTWFNFKEQMIQWRVEWIFPEDGLTFVDERLEETVVIETAVKRHIGDYISAHEHAPHPPLSSHTQGRAVPQTQLATSQHITGFRESQPGNDDQATQSMESQSGSNQATQSMESQPENGQATQSMESQPENGQATQSMESQPENGQATQSMESQPENGQATQSMESQPENGQATQSMESQPENGQATQSMESQSENGQATQSMESQTENGQATQSMESQPGNNQETQSMESQPENNQGTQSMESQPENGQATQSMESQPDNVTLVHQPAQSFPDQATEGRSLLTVPLSELLSRPMRISMVAPTVGPAECARCSSLLHYTQPGAAPYSVLCRAIGLQAGKTRYHRLERGAQLTQALTSKCIVEFPTLYVVPQHLAHTYPLISPEEEEELVALRKPGWGKRKNRRNKGQRSAKVKRLEHKGQDKKGHGHEERPEDGTSSQSQAQQSTSEAAPAASPQDTEPSADQKAQGKKRRRKRYRRGGKKSRQSEQGSESREAAVQSDQDSCHVISDCSE